MKLNLKERMMYGGEEFLPEDSPFDVPGDIPKQVAERVQEMNKGSIIEDIGEENENENGAEEDITFPDEEESNNRTTVEVEESEPILEPGVHSGEITDLKTRAVKVKDGEVQYVDVTIKTESEEGEEIEITAGYPNKVTRRSMLGKLLKRVGLELEPGQKVNLEEILVGEEVRFQVRENDKGYADVIRDTVQPA